MEKMHCYNLVYYKLKLWEKLLLAFVPLEQHEAPGSIIWYKKFANRMYIYGYIRAQAVSGETHTTGNNSTQGYENAGNN